MDVRESAKACRAEKSSGIQPWMGMRMWKFWIVSLVFFVSTPHMLAEGTVLDRLVLEVNGKSYTQRQVEVYTLLRAVAQGRGAQSGLITLETWPKALQIFQDEAILLESLQKDPAKNDVPTADSKNAQSLQAEVERLQINDANFQGFMKGYRVSESELRQAIRMLLLVQSGLQLHKPAEGNSNVWLVLDPQSPWYTDVKRTLPTRYYTGAKTYLRLQERRR